MPNPNTTLIVEEIVKILQPSLINPNQSILFSMVEAEKKSNTIRNNLKNNPTCLNFSFLDLNSFPKGIEKFTFFEALNLSNNHINLLYHHQMIFTLTYLNILNLNNNELMVLPKEIGDLPNLTHLYLKDNMLKSLPDEIELLQNLTTLDISKNKFRLLPYAIGMLENLQTLFANNNELIFLCVVEMLKNLHLLDARGNKLAVFPDEIAKLNHLKKFYIDNDKQLIPKCLKYLTKYYKKHSTKSDIFYSKLEENITLNFKKINPNSSSLNHISPSKTNPTSASTTCPTFRRPVYTPNTTPSIREGAKSLNFFRKAFNNNTTRITSAKTTSPTRITSAKTISPTLRKPILPLSELTNLRTRASTSSPISIKETYNHNFSKSRANSFSTIDIDHSKFTTNHNTNDTLSRSNSPNPKIIRHGTSKSTTNRLTYY